MRQPRRLALSTALLVGVLGGFLAASVARAQALDGKWWKRPRIAQELALVRIDVQPGEKMTGPPATARVVNPPGPSRASTSTATSRSRCLSSGVLSFVRGTVPMIS